MKIERVARQALPLLLLSLAPSGIARAQCLEFAPGFGPQGGGLNNGPLAQVVFDDGSGPALIVGGRFSYAGNLPVNNIARWDGSTWSPLGEGLSQNPGVGEFATVYALAVFDDGNGPALYAGGTYQRSGSTFIDGLAKWDGSAWVEVAGPPVNPIVAMTVFDDGNGPALYTGSSFGVVMRYDGSSWSTLGSGHSHLILAVQWFDDGNGPKLYASNQFGVKRLDGATWSGFLGGQVGSVESMIVFDDGSGPALYAAGTVDLQAGAPFDRIAKWDGLSWSNVGAGIQGVAVHDLEIHDDGGGAKLYAGGRFSSAGGAPASHLASWDGTAWSAIPGWTQTVGVSSLASFDDGGGAKLHVGGDMLTAGPVVSRGIARWDGTNWDDMIAGPFEGVVGTPFALAAFDDGSGEALYAGGLSMTFAGEVPVQGIARWNGTSWSAVGGGIGGDIYTMKAGDDGTGPALFVGGAFTSAGGSPASNVAKWDGQTWTSLGAPGGTVLALAVYDSGTGPKIYAGGVFSGGIKVWNGSSWVAHPAGPLDAHVACMTVHNDGTGPALYVGGKFARANGTIPTGRIAKWKGGAWTPLHCGLGVGDATNNEVTLTLETFDFGAGPELVAGGTFTQAGCAPSSNVVRWNGATWSSLEGLGMPVALLDFDDGSGSALYAGSSTYKEIMKWDGSTWRELDGDVSSLANSAQSGGIRALASFENVPNGGPDLFAAGGTVASGALASIGIAQWRGCAGGPGTEYCFGDGSDGECPCSNEGLPGHGCENSGATGGAVLSASGRRHPDTVVFTAVGERPTALSIFLQGNASIGPVNYGDGLRCAGGALKRLYTKTASGGQISAPQMGDLSITGRSAQAGDPIQPGSTRHYQTYYRDGTAAFCPSPAGSTFNSTNGIRIEW